MSGGRLPGTPVAQRLSLEVSLALSAREARNFSLPEGTMLSDSEYADHLRRIGALSPNWARNQNLTPSFWEAKMSVTPEFESDLQVPETPLSGSAWAD